ncbi:dihydrodipicolinate synthase family protein [Paenibacillus arenilitoris]|uniref:Dihydrodipicolinate synthase family protein n=1 Tax=Paenibacillus arenilitoris TaxID=2772299 RepID=A0A927H810_9BACL|nr:dihydrodipicolinate synthase family protein [Paenibacillus arenilitoris]MBD2871097.1 dihydrodipicolinate synthase family protein [Paenibacillus arenilitoris]
MKRLFGVTTAMVTPFTLDGQVDLKKVEQLTEFLIGNGVHGLFPLGTTGEMIRLSVAERKQVAETVIRTAAGRVTVFIHAGAATLADTVELALHAHAAGADGIGVVTPFFLGASDLELERYYVTVASTLPDDFPIYLYNIPQCAANDLKTEVAERVQAACSNVVGIKYSYPDFLRTNEYLSINGGNFSVMQGADRLFLPALAMGCDGVISGVSCVYPEPFVAVYNAYMNKDLERARELQRIAIRYCEVLKSGSNMSYFKEALKLRGIDAGFMRAPQLDLDKAEVRELERKLSELPAWS